MEEMEYFQQLNEHIEHAFMELMSLILPELKKKILHNTFEYA